jgi:hypothetical protein
VLKLSPKICIISGGQCVLQAGYYRPENKAALPYVTNIVCSVSEAFNSTITVCLAKQEMLPSNAKLFMGKARGTQSHTASS